MKKIFSILAFTVISLSGYSQTGCNEYSIKKEKDGMSFCISKDYAESSDKNKIIFTSKMGVITLLVEDLAGRKPEDLAKSHLAELSYELQKEGTLEITPFTNSGGEEAGNYDKEILIKSTGELKRNKATYFLVFIPFKSGGRDKLAVVTGYSKMFASTVLVSLDMMSVRSSFSAK